MRVLHVSTALNLGGAETMLFRMLEAAKPGDEHIVVSLIDLGVVAKRIAQLGVETRALHLSRVPNPVKIARLSALCARVRPDVVQTWMYHADLIGGLAAKAGCGARIVWGIHNSTLDPRTTRRTTRLTVALCSRLSRHVPDAIVSVSRSARDLHVAKGYDPGKFVVIPNGFDVAQLLPDPALRSAMRTEVRVDDGTVLIGLVARVHPQKDHSNFIRAAGLLSRRRKDVRFLLCGGVGIEGGGDTSPKNAELVRMIKEQGILDRFVLLGPRDDMPRVLNALDICTLSSSHGEAFPLVIGEAMACGTPCVVTDVGDSEYLVGDTGRVVPPRDARALADAWEHMIELGPVARRLLGEAARARVERNFGLAHVVGEYRALYERLLGGAVLTGAGAV